MSDFEILCIKCRTLLEDTVENNPSLKRGYYCPNCDYLLDIEITTECKKVVA